MLPIMPSSAPLFSALQSVLFTAALAILGCYLIAKVFGVKP